MTGPNRLQVTVAAVLCMALDMSAIFMGSFPVFLGPVSREMGWGHAVFSQVITISSVCAALLMPFAGRLIDRIGVRWPVAIGLTLIGLSMVLLSFMRGTDTFFWTAALSLGMGASLAGPPSFVALVSSWYDHHRALALSVVLSVTPMCAQAIVAPVVQKLIVGFGWRETYQLLAGTVLVVGLAASLTSLRPNPSGIAMRPLPAVTKRSSAHAATTSTFWLLVTANCLLSASLIGFSVHVVGWLTSRSISPESASAVMSVLFLSGVAGALLSASFVDKTSSLRIVQLFFAIPLVGLAIMAATTSLPVILLGASLLGAGMSATSALTPFLLTRYFGLKGSAEIFGILLGLTMIAIGLAPVLIGLGIDRTGGYTIPLFFVAGAVVVATFCIGLLDRLRVATAKQDDQAPARTLPSGSHQ
ncbi:MFS transporter [Burkholderia cenocepacia]|nr:MULTISPECIES: MFS transporter [Burkholderia]MBL3961176.1 MFS transporter [Burkholderia sp. KCJ3K979]MCW3610759.1 MFS transporter [Burkholderia cenocepacia]MCW5191773.1 MFS transporter [Burkholderia cenocepacia]